MISHPQNGGAPTVVGIAERRLAARTAAYASALAAAALGLAAGLAVTGYPLGNPWVIGGLAAVAALAERGRVRIGSQLESSISLLPTLFAAALFGPLGGLVVGAASMLGGLRRPYLKWCVFISSRAVTGAVTGFAALWAGGLAQSRLGGIALSTVESAR